MVPMVPMVSSGNACEVIDVNSLKASRKLGYLENRFCMNCHATKSIFMPSGCFAWQVPASRHTYGFGIAVTYKK